MASTPRHVALIMDGNGRWATAQGLPRSAGHLEGAKRIPPIASECTKQGIEAFTIYSFSTENWARSPEEVDTLMMLCVAQLKAQQAFLLENNCRFRHVGSREGLPQEVLDGLDYTTEVTASNTGMWFNLAFNYGAREEITHAAKQLAMQVQAGTLNPEDITTKQFASALYTNQQPDVDMLIRTSGEVRVSNYLLWQISYAEIFVVDKPWPEFHCEDFQQVLSQYAQRDRRYGKA